MKTPFTFFILLLTLTVSAQTTISGTVSDKKGNPIPGINIYIENSYDGASSDMNGDFSFVTYGTGAIYLIASSIGFKTWTKKVELSSETTINIELQEDINTIDAVTITAGSFAANDKSRAAIMKSLDVYTTPTAVGDIMAAMRTMPGTQNSADDGRLLVRGGDAYESSTYIDGLIVTNPYYSKTPDIATRGRFSPSLFEGVQFNTGGYSAEYGQALSSVLILNSTGVAEEPNTGLSAMGIGGEANHTFATENQSFMLSGAHYNYGLYSKLFKSNVDWKTPTKGYNGTAVYRLKTKSSGLLKAYFTGDNTKLAYRTTIDNNGTQMLIGNKSTSLYSNISYGTCLSDKTCYKVGISSSYNKNGLTLDNDSVNTNEKNIEARIKFTHELSDKVMLKWGVSDTYNSFNQDYIEDEGTTYSGNYNEHLIGIFATSEILFSKNFAIRPGIRIAHSSAINQGDVAPRFALAYKTGKKSQLSAAWGMYYQTPNSSYLKYTTNLQFEKAMHNIVSYQYGNASERLFRVEAYYKTYNNLITYDIGENSFPTNISNNGNGYAKGIDLFWRDQKSIKGFDYWITYSYIDTKRKYQYYPTEATPSFISNHSFSAVGKYWINKISTQVGASYSVSSGKPYNNPNSNIFNDERTKAYTDLSLNFSHVFYLGNQYSVLYCSINNVLGDNNIISYRTTSSVNEQGYYNLIPVRRNYKRTVFVGLFINF